LHLVEVLVVVLFGHTLSADDGMGVSVHLGFACMILMSALGPRAAIREAVGMSKC
jgi:hypothetical protein